MTLTPAPHPGHEQRPANWFYWADLETEAFPRAHRRDPKKLIFLAESRIPVPIDSLHLVFVPCDDANRMIACGADRSSLESIASSGALTCCPAALPDHLRESGCSPADFNLLTGPFMPAPVRTESNRLMNRIVIAWVLVALIVAIGLARRSDRLIQAHGALHDRLREMYVQVLGSDALDRPQPLSLQLTAEARRLAQSHDAAARSGDGMAMPDLGLALQQLLKHWPRDVQLQTESITVTPDTMTIRAIMPTEQSTRALEGFGSWESWRRQQPEITNTRGRTVLNLRYVRADPNVSEVFRR